MATRILRSTRHEKGQDAHRISGSGEVDAVVPNRSDDSGDRGTVLLPKQNTMRQVVVAHEVPAKQIVDEPVAVGITTVLPSVTSIGVAARFRNPIREIERIAPASRVAVPAWTYAEFNEWLSSLEQQQIAERDHTVAVGVEDPACDTTSSGETLPRNLRACADMHKL